MRFASRNRCDLRRERFYLSRRKKVCECPDLTLGSVCFYVSRVLLANFFVI